MTAPLQAIAQGVGISRSTAKTAIRRLQRGGFITVSAHRKGLPIRVKVEPYFKGPES